MSEMIRVPIDVRFSEELESDPDFGVELEAGGFVVQIPRRIVAVSIEDLCKAAGVEYKTSVLDERYRTYVIPHRVGVMRTSGMREISEVAVSVEYDNGGATCCIQHLLPSPEVVEIAGMSFGLELDGNAAADAAPAGPGALVATPVDAKLGLNVKASAGARLALQGSVFTHRIAAIGIGDRRARWQFRLGNEPLHGRDVETWTVVILPRRQANLVVRTQVEIAHRIFMVTTRASTAVVTSSCELISSSPTQAR